MKIAHPDFILDRNGKKKSVVIPIADWKRILNALEDLEDIKAYEKAKARREKVVPFEM